MKQRIIAMLAILILCVAFVLTGCAIETKDEEPATTKAKEKKEEVSTEEEPVKEEIPTLTLLTTWDPGVPIDSNSLVFTYWGEQTGVKFDVTIPPRDVFKEKVNATLAANEIPDVMRFFQDQVTYKEYGPDLFVNLSKLMDDGKLPNYSKMLNKYPETQIMIESPADNQIYGFGIIQDFDYLQGSFWSVRNDILLDGGMDADDIVTVDDFKAACQILKEATGDYITSTRLGYGYYVFTTATYFAPIQINNIVSYDNEQGKYIVNFDKYEDNYKQYVELEKWMYDNQMLHPDFLTMNDQELFAGYADGNLPLEREQLGLSKKLHETNPDVSVDDVKTINNFTLANGFQSYRYSSAHCNIGYRSPWAINKDCASIEKAANAFDWLYSEEGTMFTFYGIEGEHYELDASEPAGLRQMNIKSDWTKNDDGTYPDGLLSIKELAGLNQWWTAGIVPKSNRFGLAVSKENKKEAFELLDAQDAWIDSGQLKTKALPQLSLTEVQQDELKDIYDTADLDTYVSENLIQFIIGDKDMSQWDAFVEGIYEYDVQTYADKMNEYYTVSAWASME